MSSAEKQERQAALYSAVSTKTTHAWAANLLYLLMKQNDKAMDARPTPYLDRDLAARKYKDAKRRLFLFDYDVCSCIITKSLILNPPKGNTHSDSQITQGCRPIRENARGHVKVTLRPEEHDLHYLRSRLQVPRGTFRTSEESWDVSWTWSFLEVSRCWLLDELDGDFWYELDERCWRDFQVFHGGESNVSCVEWSLMSWKRTPGSHVEVKECSVTWHYRASDPEWGYDVSVVC